MPKLLQAIMKVNICLARHTIPQICELFVVVPFARGQSWYMLRESAPAQHMHAQRYVLSLLALQFEHGTPLSHLIFLLRQESH